MSYLVKPHVLFHVYNISGYLIACLEELSNYAEIVVVETPCQGIEKGGVANRIRWIDRSRIANVADLEDVIGDFKPDVFFCGGWSDKVSVEYAGLLHRRGTRTVLMADTPWQTKARQIVHCLYSRFSLVPTFDFAWVAGEPQERYMRCLGFNRNRIRRGCYCADTVKFASIGEMREKRFSESRNWHHVFLYTGRYITVKNIRRMERAFLRAIEQMPDSDWILRCIGTGCLWDERTIHPRIEHLGYKRPDEIQEFVRDAGCFVLPSVYEPWGVVVHEAALMGLPMLCSNKVQAATAYLRAGENGFSFDPLDEDDMVATFKRIMMSGDDALHAMGRKSHQLGMKYTLSDWRRTVEGFVLKKQDQ